MKRKNWIKNVFATIMVRNDLVIILLFYILFSSGGCAHLFPGVMPSPYDRCIERLWAKIQSLPIKEHHETLDGQIIELESYRVYALANYLAIVPFKFYHWKSEIWSFEVPLAHKARVYFNLDSTCLVRKRGDPKLGTYGDFAELYDSHGLFMGFVVRIDQDLYIPIKAFNYRGTWTHAL